MGKNRYLLDRCQMESDELYARNGPGMALEHNSQKIWDVLYIASV